MKGNITEIYLKETKESLANLEATVKCAAYSFDMAHQVHVPSTPLQPDPIYFLIPFKISIFGVKCESVNIKVDNLIPHKYYVHLCQFLYSLEQKHYFTICY